MPICDICCKSLTQSEMRIVKPEIVTKATMTGYLPSRIKTDLFFKILGLFTPSKTKSFLSGNWQAIVAQNPSADWGLCDKCYHELSKWH